MTPVFLCDKCQRQWLEAAAAIACEATHEEVATFAVINWCSELRERAFPLRIKATLVVENAWEYNYATYVLERIGPRPV